jgi:hypothetical protein
MLVTRTFLYITFRIPSKSAPPHSRFPSHSTHRERYSVSRALLQQSLSCR